MTDSDSPTTQPSVLSEELAHRVLARAVELDVLAQSGMTVERLRGIASELGIPEATFAAALAEVQQLSRITHSYAVGDHPVLRTGFVRLPGGITS